MRRFVAHLPEYGIEAALLGFFMLSACGFGVLLEHPESPVRQAIGDPALRRVLMGLAMGTTAVAIIYSPWGGRSGAHINPATTLTFWRLGRIRGVDVAGYVGAQVLGGVLGVALASALLGPRLADASVRFVVTRPGRWGSMPALFAEVAISAILMGLVVGPLLGMNLGAFLAIRARARTACPKLHHPDSQRCIFCGHAPA